MASFDGGKEVGRLSIRVTANTTKLSEEIRKAAEKAASDVTIGVDADTSEFLVDIAKARALAEKGNVTIEVDAKVNDRGLRERVKSATKRASKGAKIEIPVSLDARDFETKAIELHRQWQANIKSRALWIEPNMRPSAIRKIEEEIDRLGDVFQNLPKFNLFGNKSKNGTYHEQMEIRRSVLAQVEMAKEQLERHSNVLQTEIGISFDEALLEEEIRKADKAFKAFDADLTRARTVQLEINFEKDRVKQQHSALLDELDRRTKRLGVSTEIVGRKMALAFGTLAVSGILFGVSALTTYLASAAGQAVALAAGLTQTVGALLVLPGIVMGSVAALGVLIAGFNGMGEAISQLYADESDPAAIEEALSKLSPSARKAAEAIGGLKGPLRDLKMGIQESMFTGLDAGIERLSDFAIAMRPSLMSIANGWNSIFKGVIGGLTDTQATADFGTTFDRFGDMMTTFATGLPAFIRGFAQLGVASSEFFNRIGGWGAEKMREFERTIARITSDGSFDKWVEQGVRAFGDLWDIVKNVSSAMGDVFKLSGSEMLLSQIRAITQGMENWTSSSTGMKSISDIFGTARQMINNVHEAVKPLGGVFTELFQGMGRFTTGFSSTFVPAMENSRDAARKFADAMVGLSAPLGSALGAAVEGVGSLSQSLGPSLANLAQQITPLIKELTNFATGAGSVFIQTLTAILSVVNSLLQAVPGLSVVLGGLFAVSAIGVKGATMAKDLGLFAAGIGAVDSAAGKAEKSTGFFAKSLGKLSSFIFPVAIVAGLLGIVSVIYDSLNPALADFSNKLKSIPADLAQIGSAAKAGMITATEAVKEHAKVWDELKLAQQAAIKEGDNFANSGWLSAIGYNAGKMQQDQLKNSGIMGQPIAEAALKEQLKNLPAVTKAQAEYNAAQIAAAEAVEKYGKSSNEARAAAEMLNIASLGLSVAKRDEAAAHKTAADAIMDQIGAQQTLLAVQGDAAAAQLNVNSAMTAYQDAVAKYGAGSLEATAALGSLSSAVATATTNIGVAAQQQAIATGASDGLSESYLAQHDYLQGLIDANNEFSGEAAIQQQALRDTTAQSILSAEGFALLKNNIVAVPNAKEVVITADAYKANKTVIDTNYNVKTMPDGTVVISAKDNATQVAKNIVSGIGAMVGVITIQGKYNPPSNLPAGGLSWGFASGGPVFGAGTATSDSIPAWLSNGEYVIRAAAVKKIGYDTLDMINRLGEGTANTLGRLSGKFSGGGDVKAWATALAASRGHTAFERPTTRPSMPTQQNFVVQGDVDTSSLAREIDRVSGFNPNIVGVT